jgi:hypothetical protein
MPFDIGAPLAPDGFVGRKKAIDHVSGRLGEYTRQSTCLAGGPLTGKTSLLRYLAQSDVSANLPGLNGACRVFFDGYSVGVSMLPSGFWGGIFRGLQANPNAAPLQDLLADKLAKAKANQIDLYDLEDVFDEFAKAKMPVVIFINNFEILLQNSHFWPPYDFFHLVRSLGQREPRGVSFVITTYRKLLDLWDPNKGASPFYNIIGNVPVGLLEDDEIRQFLKNGFDELGLPLEADVEETIIEASEGHPYLVNYVAGLLVEWLKAGKAIGEKMLEDAFQDPEGPVVNLIRQIRGCLSPTEKALLDPRNKPRQTDCDPEDLSA